MPRRQELTSVAQTLIAEACEVNAELEENPARMERRRTLWREAFDAGATYGQISEACSVSAHLVRLEVSKARDRDWATGTRP